MNTDLIFATAILLITTFVYLISSMCVVIFGTWNEPEVRKRAAKDWLYYYGSVVGFIYILFIITLFIGGDTAFFIPAAITFGFVIPIWGFPIFFMILIGTMRMVQAARKEVKSK